MAKFNLGDVVVTAGIDKVMQESPAFTSGIYQCLERYEKGDWGELCDEDKAVNEDALKYPDDLYLLAAYTVCLRKIYIITNRKSEMPGDNVTTVLFVEEY